MLDKPALISVYVWDNKETMRAYARCDIENQLAPENAEPMDVFTVQPETADRVTENGSLIFYCIQA